MQVLAYIQEHIWLILFLVWGFPLSFYRSKFRKLVYDTDHWIINIKPVFIKEIKVLFNISAAATSAIARYRNFYRIYLLVYILLFLAYQFFS